MLQAFALKTVLERLGHEVWLVDNHRREKPVSNLFLKTVLRRAVESLFHRKEIFAELNTALTQDYKKSEIEKFIYRRLSPRTAPVYDADDYASIAADGGYDLYIVGSDQVWRPRYAKELGPYFFSFLEGTAARRIAYAASFGAAECEYTREERERCARLLAEFGGASPCGNARASDNAATTSAATMHGRCWTPPCCSRRKTIARCSFRASPRRRRSTATCSGPVSAVRREIGRTAAARGLEIVRMTDRTNESEGKMPGIGQWLSALHDARYVVTDSFHACAFCILFHKPFAVYINRRRGSARIRSLLEQFGLEGRIASPGKPLAQTLDAPIDWETVERTLEERRADSRGFLALHLQEAPPLSAAAGNEPPGGSLLRPAADFGHRGPHVADQRPGREPELQSAHPGADIDEGQPSAEAWT